MTTSVWSAPTTEALTSSMVSAVICAERLVQRLSLEEYQETSAYTALCNSFARQLYNPPIAI